MPNSTSIPRTNLSVGGTDFGPFTVPDEDTRINILLDRTVNKGLNSQPSTTTLDIEITGSNDGGNTWLPMASAGAQGGDVISKYTGLPEVSLGVSVTLMQGVSRLLKATTTVTGTSVTIQGVLSTA